MPRDSNGTYSLPSGNPVVTETVIESAWANTTLADVGLALTNSLDRAGSGGMTGQLKLANGTIGSPGLTFGTEPTSGLYRNAAGDHRYSISSNDVIQIVAGAFRTVDGVIGTPAWSFINDTDLGWYRNGANDMRAVVAAADIFQIVAAGVRTIAGTNAAPSGSFITDTDTGSYLAGANDFGIAAGGVAASAFSSTRVSSLLQHQFAAGSAGTPSISFAGDPNTGAYSLAADDIGFSANGSLILSLNGTRALFVGAVQAPDGSVGSPGITFGADTNTGIYRIGADNIGFSTGGTLRAEITSAGVFNYATLEVGWRSLNTTGQNAGYTFTAADSGRAVAANTSGNFTVPNATLGAGTVTTFINTTGANCTLVQGAGVTFRLMGASGTTGNRTVADYGVASIISQNGSVFLVGGPGVS